MHILDLPDEVLVILCQCLTGQDKLTLNKTCKKFNTIIQDKRVTRKLEFQGCFSFSITDLNGYLNLKFVEENVKELNVTGCYWLRSMDLRRCIVKLCNLEALYAAGTLLSFPHVVQILKLLTQIRRLSFTWRQQFQRTRDIYNKLRDIKQKLELLEFLFIYHGDSARKGNSIILAKFIASCCNLQELWIFFLDVSRGTGIDLGFNDHGFPRLHTFATNVVPEIQSGQSENSTLLFEQVLRSNGSKQAYKYLWVPIAVSANEVDISQSRAFCCKPESVTFLDCPKLEQVAVGCGKLNHLLDLKNVPLKKLLWGKDCSLITWDSLWTSCTELEELNVCVCVKQITNIYRQENLRKLALPSCIFTETGIPTASWASISYSVMRVVVESCPNITEFEFKLCLKDYGQPFESCLTLIGKWNHLCRLKLSHMPCVQSGIPFMHIFRSCKKLESISLDHLGGEGNCYYIDELIKALPLCSNLKDFRIDQPNVLSVDGLLSALMECPLLERICIISLRQSKFSHHYLLLDLVKELPRLVCLYFCMDALTKQHCVQLSKDIKKSYKKTHPSLFTLIRHCELDSKSTAAIPAVHYFEMIRDASQICTILGTGGRYRYFSHT